MPEETTTTITGTVSLNETQFNEIMAALNAIKIATESFNTEFKHWHRSHEHLRGHNCSDISLTCGGAFIPYDNIPPLATILSMEYMCNEDRDGNGKIYGYDFDILDDGTKPLALASMSNMETWLQPPIMITWQQYVDWARGTGSNPL